jgi:hypothetical protein
MTDLITRLETEPASRDLDAYVHRAKSYGRRRMSDYFLTTCELTFCF